jgi:DNA-binding transcriptional regulator YhcF (GntR family)
MDYQPGVTKTAQVADHMRRRIASRDWKVGQGIPGLPLLETEYGVSFGTVRAAQQILVGEGLLSRPEQGISTRVISRPAGLDAREALGQVRAAYRTLGEELEHLEAAPGLGVQQPMDLGRLGNRQVHDFARFHAAAAALAQGCRAVRIEGPSTRIVVDDRTIQISARRLHRSPWQVSASRPVVEDAYAMIFVDLTGPTSDFYIAPAQWVREDVQKRFASWLESVGGERPRNPDSDHATVELKHIREWHQRWDLLTAGQASSS